MNRLSYLWVALLLLFHAVREAEADPPLAVAPFDSRQAKAHQRAWANHLGKPVQITNSLGMKFNLIPPGEFMMGSPKQEADHQDDETQHLVKITKPFYLGAHEVTQEQYEQVMGNNPSDRKGPTKPVANVSWNYAVEFCRKLSDEEGVEYRLPTEAEWEYACRAGTTTAYSFGNDASQLSNYGWYRTNAWDIGEKYAHPVGEKLPNAWGLFDMHGNVREWCQDWYGPYERLKVVSDPTGAASGSGRVLRGGAFSLRPVSVRAAFRDDSYRPDYPNHAIGFRMARTYPLSP
jgi:formylglycine-generating enzyme required for sulfatase activity